MRFPNFKKERFCHSQGYKLIIGCDEVGVSPLAGPVVAAACFLDPSSISGRRSKKKWYYRVRDSKTTTEKERLLLVKEIKEHSRAYGIGAVWPEDIDKLNIHHASLLAMKLATEDLLKQLGQHEKSYLYVDGRFKIKGLPEHIKQECVIKGDSHILSISAASIIAKVHRDNIMKELDKEFPQYGFSRHKGYPTKAHQEAIKKLGITPIHRKSFFKKGSLKDAKGLS